MYTHVYIHTFRYIHTYTFELTEAAALQSISISPARAVKHAAVAMGHANATTSAFRHVVVAFVSCYCFPRTTFFDYSHESDSADIRNV